MRLYISIRPLPEDLRPCVIVRSEGGHRAILAIHPGLDQAARVEWAVENLTLEERGIIRHQYGLPPVDVPLIGSVYDVPDYVPPGLRLPQERDLSTLIEQIDRFRATVP